jgi:diguanylate cyclase (GGDEF)-like protein
MVAHSQMLVEQTMFIDTSISYTIMGTNVVSKYIVKDCDHMLIKDTKKIDKNSVAYRNVLILLFSLLPFVLGIGYSAVKSSSMDYFGVAINISGSQRMRTMLISNYAQQIEDAIIENDEEKYDIARKVLTAELNTYERYMDALINGATELNLIENKFPNIVNEIVAFEAQYKSYIDNAKQLIIVDPDLNIVDDIVAEALPLKNNIHHVVGLFETQYKKEMKSLTYLDLTMILIAIIVTTMGLMLTRAIRKNEYFANFDHLTGLLTRYNLYENIKNKDPKNYDVYFIDLNKFKHINDTFGHSVGDEILKEVSIRLIQVFGKENVYRYGGDEFVVLSDCSVKSIQRYGIELKNKLAQPVIDMNEREHYIGLSFGVVARGIGPLEWDKRIHFADELMYDAKSYSGHAVYCLTEEGAYKRLNLDYAVLEGIKKQEFVPHFQSIYNVTDQHLEIQMVLCRWNLALEQVVMPSEFLPVLKRKGLLTVFDLYMIHQLNEIYATLDSAGKDCTYSLNLTEETLLGARHNGLVEVLENIDIPKDKLILKFIENVLTNEDILDTIELISSMGFVLAVDNFTIDISLQESVKYRSISIVKLGQATIQSMLIDDYSIKMLKEFIHMLVSIGKTVIVEGIEESNEISILKDINQIVDGNLYYSAPYEIKTKDDLYK